MPVVRSGLVSDERAAAKSELRLLLELGRGGMGVAYLAVARGPGGFTKLKVVKRLRSDLAVDPRAVEMFLAEARLAARLRHPSVVQTNEVGFDGKHYFLEMEYLEGQSLDAIERKAMRDGRRLPRPVALWILAQTCAGLHYAHELADFDGRPLQVVHRDVSPHNVFVTYDGQVKLLDFGIAKAADSVSETQTGMVKGKARYMAPEQASRGKVDRRADVFAVGVMLWQALTGERLWGDLGDLEIFVKLQSTPLPAPRSVRADVPPELDDLCRRALATDPDDRPESARAVGEALEDYLEKSGERVGAREVAALVSEWFVDRREEVHAEIQARMKDGAEAATVDVPAMSVADVSGTGSAALSHASSVAAAMPTKVRQQRQIRTLRRLAAAGIGIALLASASAVVVAIRSRSKRDAVAASASTSIGACEANASCPVGSVCRPRVGRCVPLETAECKVMADPGDARDDATVWFGVMLPASGPRAPVGALFTRAVELARRDFVQIAHGLPSATRQGASRPLAFVSCDDGADGDRAAHHLVDDLAVPAIIGFGSSDELMRLASSLFVPHDVLAVAAVNGSALITSILQPPGTPRLVYRTAFGIPQAAPPMSLFVSDWVEPHLRSTGAVPASSPLRVALVRPATTTALSIADALFTTLRFNGRSALENGDDFRQLVFATPGDTQAAHSTGDVVDEIVRFAPHVILALDTEGLARDVLAPIEARWPKAARYRPTVVMNMALYGDDLFALLVSPERRHRYFGTQARAMTMANAKFTMRYDETFTEQVTVNNSPAGTYDAAYVLAYAAAALGDEPITGSSLSRAIARLLPPGDPVDVGPTRILDALDLLHAGKNIDLRGANGTLDFDLSNGEPAADSIIQCAAVDAAGKVTGGIDSGLAYDAASHSLLGQMRCP